MSNSYYDSTGVLVLDKVTPIIIALFSGFSLDPTYPGPGEAYIAEMAEHPDPQWSDVFDALAELDSAGEVSSLDVGKARYEKVLSSLAARFGVTTDKSLSKLIQEHAFEEAPDLDSLFTLARSFNDGHGIQAIKIEGSWHGQRPLLFEFGGDGTFISEEVCIYSTTSRAVSLGADLRRAIVDADYGLAAARISQEVTRILDGISNDAVRSAIQQSLAKLLADA